MSNFRTIIASLLLATVVGAQSLPLFGTVGDPVPPEVEAMTLKGLKYLVASQTQEGNWSDNYGRQPAVVGLAILAMLAHGEDPNHGPYSVTIKRGLSFILKSQREDNGYIGTSMYNHGFATLALAEAYGAVDDDRLGPALEKAVGLLLTSQASNTAGAWRYSPTSQDADTTVSGACVVALFAARNAGVAVPDKAFERALKFYETCQSPEGGFGYTNASGPNAPRSAIGTLVFSLSRVHDKAVKTGLAFLESGAAQAFGQPYYYYYLYYASQAYFQADIELWNGWNKVNIRTLKKAQNADGSWTGQFGQSFGTSSALLSLALNYRFLPIYER